MNKEELIAEAIKRYPIGTVFLEANATAEKYTVKEVNPQSNHSWRTDEHIIIFVEGITGSGKYLYNKGKWAEVVSYPDDVINNFPLY